MANEPANNIDPTGMISKPWTSFYDPFFNGSLDQDDNPLDEDMLHYNGLYDNYYDNGMTGAADNSLDKHENQEEANALNGETKEATENAAQSDANKEYEIDNKYVNDGNNNSNNSKITSSQAAAATTVATMSTSEFPPLAIAIAAVSTIYTVTLYLTENPSSIMVLSPVGATILSNIGKETQMQFAKPSTKNKEDNSTTGSAEHTKGARKSTEGRQEDGQARKLRDRVDLKA